MPSRWKTAVLIWLAIYPSITFLLWLAGPRIASWPLALRTLALHGRVGAADGLPADPAIQRLLARGYGHVVRATRGAEGRRRASAASSPATTAAAGRRKSCSCGRARRPTVRREGITARHVQSLASEGTTEGLAHDDTVDRRPRTASRSARARHRLLLADVVNSIDRQPAV